jgi:hypothetical protein
MKAAFVVNARNKEKWVARAVRGALEQTVPCDILLSDQGSTDDTLAVIKQTVNDFGSTHHNVRIVQCPITGSYGMTAANAHFMWCAQQFGDDVEFIYQCSADDYSLPKRVEVCEKARNDWKCDVVACTMFFEEPGANDRTRTSGFPKEPGYVHAGVGVTNLAFGSTIAGFSREFINLVGSAGPNTMDVYYGYLAALRKGFYVVCDPQHVHVEHAGLDNMGFQGKMRGASGDDTFRVGELNHYQLLKLYFACADKAKELFPQGVEQTAYDHLMSMIVQQAFGWMKARDVLHAKGLTPGIM